MHGRSGSRLINRVVLFKAGVQGLQRPPVGCRGNAPSGVRGRAPRKSYRFRRGKAFKNTYSDL